MQTVQYRDIILDTRLKSAYPIPPRAHKPTDGSMIPATAHSSDHRSVEHVPRAACAALSKASPLQYQAKPAKCSVSAMPSSIRTSSKTMRKMMIQWTAQPPRGRLQRHHRPPPSASRYQRSQHHPPHAAAPTTMKSSLRPRQPAIHAARRRRDDRSFAPQLLRHVLEASPELLRQKVKSLG